MSGDDWPQGWSPRRLAELIRFFRLSHCGENAGELRREQAGIFARTATLFTILGVGSCSLFTPGFIEREPAAITSTYVIIIFLYAVLLRGAVHWRRSRDDVEFIRSSIRVLVVLGIAWGCLVNLFALTASADQRGILIGLIMALVSSPMLGVPISAALAFFVPVTMFCSVAILVTLQPIEGAGVLSFLGFVVFALVGLVTMNKIILERSMSRLSLQRQHETLRVFLREYEQGSTDWLWETDPIGRLRNVSPGMIQVFCGSFVSLEGVPLSDVGLQDLGDGTRPLIDLLSGQVAFRDLPLSVRERARERHVHLTGHPVYDENGNFGGFRGIGSDVTDKKEAQERVEFLATHDDLTGLLNRKAFLDEVERRCRDPAPFAILVMDLDNFKAINDDFGHVAGDRLLRDVGNRLRRVLAPRDASGRLGGDEFVLLLADTVKADALSRSQILNELLNQDIDVDGLPVTTSASIGIALYPTDGDVADVLLRRADLALYQAKERKNARNLFEAWMETDYFGRIRLNLELTAALRQDEIFVEYQPVLDVLSDRIVSIEALVRWQHPINGVMAPGDFIPVAEGSELIEELGAQVLRIACHDAVRWPEPLPVAVNLSPKQLRSGRFVAVMTACLQESGLPADRLVLEVTETVFLAASDRTVGQLDAIRKLGVRIVLDDFGTGYSSLTYLRGFDVDGIKIDASFIRDLPGSRKVAAIIRTIARLASDMNVHVVAEGVETAEQLAWLRANGIPFVQGFVVGRPGSSDALAALLLARSLGSAGDAAQEPLAADLKS